MLIGINIPSREYDTEYCIIQCWLLPPGNRKAYKTIIWRKKGGGRGARKKGSRRYAAGAYDVKQNASSVDSGLPIEIKYPTFRGVVLHDSLRNVLEYRRENIAPLVILIHNTMGLIARIYWGLKRIVAFL